ncbi:MAG: hypothetical protein JWO15_3294 [Sphingomonadales bacterium]|nr:hypothetical protein [Sphingomonadales bacterium]
MIRETDSEFSLRRSAEEKVMAANAGDGSQAISHKNLAELHERKAAENVSAAAIENEAMPVAAANGHVEVTASTGEVTALTPGAAAATADGLMARAREAGLQQNAATLSGA